MTVKQDLTTTPVNLVSTLSLVNGQIYAVQAVAGDCFLAERHTANPENGGHTVRTGETWYVTASSIPVWAWSVESNATLQVTEA